MYTTKQAARITGNPVPVLDAWAKTLFPRRAPIFVPSTPSAGSGTRRGYSLADLVALRCAHHLRRAGIPLEYVRQLAGQVRQLGGLQNPVTASRLRPLSVASDGVDGWVGHRSESDEAVAPVVVIRVDRFAREVAARCMPRLRR